MILGTYTVRSRTWAHLPSRFEDSGEVEMSCLGSAELLTDFQHIRATDHLIDSSETKFCHMGTKILSKIIKKVDDLLRLTRELGTQLRVLGGDTDGAGVH